MNHHAFVIEAGKEGVALARAWIEEHFNLGKKADVTELSYGLLSVEDARRVVEIAGQAAFAGSERGIIITADRAYHEAQNALLKLFEEPAEGTYLFLCLPSLGGLLPTLRSRVQVLKAGITVSSHAEAEAFIKATKEKRSALIKKLASGKDEEEKREHREEAIRLVNGLEQLAYAALHTKPSEALHAFLSDISVLRNHLYDRSAPVKMIFEHLSIVIPKGLV